MRYSILYVLVLFTSFPAIAQQIDQIAGAEQEGIKCGTDSSGIPASIEAGGYQWLTGAVRMEVMYEVSKVTASIPKLGLLCTQEWRATPHALAWDLAFSGDAKRAGHQVTLTFPILDPALRAQWAGRLISKQDLNCASLGTFSGIAAVGQIAQRR
jgi:hypothetical protein